MGKLVLRLLGWLPGAAPYRLARSCASLWMRLSPGKRKVAQTNLKMCLPNLEPAELAQLLRESFVHYVCSIMETGRNRYWSLHRLQALCDGMKGCDLLKQAICSGRGVLVLAPHFGAWEYLGFYMQTLCDIAILYKPPANPGLEKALLQMRSRAGGRFLPATTMGLRQLVAHIRSGKPGGLLPDQQPSAGQGRFASFFGIPALTGMLAPRLARKTGCIVLFMACERRDPGRYLIHVIPADEDIYSTDLDVAVRAVNQGVEKCIAIDPAQYLWSYKRFRSRPDGEPLVYR